MWISPLGLSLRGEIPLQNQTKRYFRRVVRRLAVDRFAVPRLAVERFAVERLAVERFAVERFAVDRFVVRRRAAAGIAGTAASAESSSSLELVSGEEYGYDCSSLGAS